MSDVRYFNFPVALLRDFMTDSQSVLKNILYYSLYSHSLRLDYGDEMERFKNAIDYYEMPIFPTPDVFYEAQDVYEFMPVNLPMVGLNTEIFLRFFLSTKSDYEKATLLGFLAIKSILGGKSYCKIDNRFWLSRMDGLSRSCDIYLLSDGIRKYSTEYMTKKIKNELKDNWGLKSYSRYTRGFYVSFDMSLENLVKTAEAARKAVKEKQKRLEEKALVQKALMEIKASQ
ncbi:hypothetical protein R1T16_09630 [Flavobacterium sp. DG1-102-2]|uniref:hypothetical protein n=1 Tax=Flavobacterium sp. DG1-102-2 TaxID=3081663 RepID=UPI002949C414|nr:hypothetical protein [Flavobacterium sp. DG1-102-2]MDV6168684.1 hypothetical protein [Flavobacterium sp. DG1-102-2]